MRATNGLAMAMLLIEIVSLANGTVAFKEQAVVLVEESNVEEETETNAASTYVDLRYWEISTAGNQIEEDSSTSGLTRTTGVREINTVTPTMDLITVIWYVATLIALISFFVVMACADTSRCYTTKPPDVETPVPPTPAPSYRQFAPPSYESVIEKRPDSIFIIPVHTSSSRESVHFTENLVTNLGHVIDPNSANSESTTQTERGRSNIIVPA